MTKRPQVKQLIESTFQDLRVLCEEKVVTPAGKEIRLMKVGGIFGEAEKPTGNRRRYRRPIMEAGIKNLQHLITSKQCLGELDHPDDGRTRLARVSHLITKLELRPDNVIYGEALILNTAKGRDLQALFEGGVTVGCSSRGFGDTEMAEDGFEDVKEGFQLKSFDFVFEPAHAHALPQVFESLESDPLYQLAVEQTMLFEQQNALTAGRLPAAPPVEVSPVVEAPVAAPAFEMTFTEAQVTEMVQAATTQMRADQNKFFAEELKRREATFEAEKLQLKQQMSEARNSLLDQARAELSADPTLNGAMLALRQAAPLLLPFMAPKDMLEAQNDFDRQLADVNTVWAAKVASLEADKSALVEAVQEMEAATIEAGYRLYLETELHGSPDRGLYNNMLGDLLQYPSLESLQQHVGVIRSEIEKSREEESKKLQAEREREQAIMAEAQQASLAYQERIIQLEQLLAEKNGLLSEARGQLSTTANTGVEMSERARIAEIESYAERRIASSANPEEARRILSSTNLYGEEQIDKLLENVNSSGPKDQSILNRLRTVTTRRGAVQSPMTEELAKKPVVGLSIGDLAPGDLAELGLQNLDQLDRLSMKGKYSL